VRAVIAEKLGGPEVLKLTERDTPEPGPGQVLVGVAAAGVNFADIYRRQGDPPCSSDVPYVAGMEGSGTVAAVGPGVEGPGVAARVTWTGAEGGYAEQVIVPADRVRIGGRYPLDQAARAQEDLAARHTTGKLILLSR
jgi:NADPH:quinone reductase